MNRTCVGGREYVLEKSSEEQDTNRNSLALPFIIKIALDNVSAKTSVMLSEGTLLQTFKQQPIESQNRWRIVCCLLAIRNTLEM